MQVVHAPWHVHSMHKMYAVVANIFFLILGLDVISEIFRLVLKGLGSSHSNLSSFFFLSSHYLLV